MSYYPSSYSKYGPALRGGSTSSGLSRNQLLGAGAAALISSGLAYMTGRRSAPAASAAPRVYRPKPVVYRRRPKRKKGGKMAKKPRNSVARRLRALEVKQTDTTSKLVYKYDDKDTLRPTSGQATYGYKDAVGTTAIELAIAQCRYFDPSNPATLITGSLAAPTYQQKIAISVFAKCIIKNNYHVPCVVTCGIAYPKEDTSITPNAARTNGLTDVGNPDPASTLISYKDSRQFRDLWYVKLKSKYLAPGDQIIMTKKQGRFTYDPSLQDSHSQTYQKTTKSAVFVYRCQGILGHDTAVSTEQGMLPAGIDVYIESIYYIQYNSGGAAIKTIVLNESASQTFTNSGVVSQQTVDNQAYSAS